MIITFLFINYNHSKKISNFSIRLFTDQELRGNQIYFRGRFMYKNEIKGFKLLTLNDKNGKYSPITTLDIPHSNNNNNKKNEKIKQDYIYSLFIWTLDKKQNESIEKIKMFSELTGNIVHDLHLAINSKKINLNK